MSTRSFHSYEGHYPIIENQSSKLPSHLHFKTGHPRKHHYKLAPLPRPPIRISINTTLSPHRYLKSRIKPSRGLRILEPRPLEKTEKPSVMTNPPPPLKTTPLIIRKPQLPSGKRSAPPTDPATPSPTPARTAFSSPIPEEVSPLYLTSSAPGLQYALYTLVPVSKDSLQSLLQTLAWHALCEDWASAIVLAPTHDFSDASQRTVRDVFDYHTSLLDVVKGNPWNLHVSRFLVVTHEDWDRNGLLLVDLDTHPEVRGIVGIHRLTVDMAGSTLVLRERDTHCWADFKLAGVNVPFKDPIEGYTASKWEELGVQWYETGELADDELSDEEVASGKEKAGSRPGVARKIERSASHSSADISPLDETKQ